MMMKAARIVSVVKAANRRQVKQYFYFTPGPQQKYYYSTAATWSKPGGESLKQEEEEEEEKKKKKTTEEGDPCLDLYFGVQPNTPTSKKNRLLKQLLPVAWSHNPLTTLKLIANLVHHSNYLGKGDDEAFYTAALWLHRNHPKTLAGNAVSICGGYYTCVGCMVQLVQILYRLVTPRTDEAAIEMYHRDSDYRLLHDLVTDLFADRLRSNIQSWKQHKPLPHSDCVPIPKGGSTLFVETIANKLNSLIGKREEEDRRVLVNWLNQEVLEPLHHYLLRDEASRLGPKPCLVRRHLKEVKAGKSKIEDGAFVLPHEIVRYVNDNHVGQVAELQWKSYVLYYLNKKKNNLFNLSLSNSLVVYDTSSSMPPRWKDVQVALAVLVSQLHYLAAEEATAKPWRGKVINLGPEPQLQDLAALDSLKSKSALLHRTMKSEVFPIIDLHKLFHLILQAAVDGNLRPDQMIGNVIILTNFDFSDATSCWDSESDYYRSVQDQFNNKGYAVPKLVFWELHSRTSCPARPCRRTPGLAKIYGFSDALFKSFLDNDGQVDPHHVMEAAISPTEYQNLVVLD